MSHLAKEAGAYALISKRALEQADMPIDAAILELSRRLPRPWRSNDAPMTVVTEPTGQLDALNRAGEAFARILGLQPGRLDLEIVRGWALELPDKVIVARITDDPDSTTAPKTIAKRIEKLRAAAPTRYWDGSGGLAKVRLGNDLLGGVTPRPSVVSDLAHAPHIDRCIRLAAQGEIVDGAYLDDVASVALSTFLSCWKSPAANGAPVRGGRLNAMTYLAALEETVYKAFITRPEQFESFDIFKRALVRAMHLLADSEAEQRSETLDDLLTSI